MRNRKTPLYVIYSLHIHAVLLLVLWWAVPKQVPLLNFRDDIEISITHVDRPPLPVKPVAFAEPAVPSVTPKKESQLAPKPKAGLLQMETQHTVDAPKPETRKQGNRANTRQISDRLPPIVGKPTHYATESLVKVNSPNQPTVNLPSTLEEDYVPPQGETKPIALESDGDLDNANASPAVNAPGIHYGSKRGDALRATSMGNSWGGAAPPGAVVSAALSST